MINSVNTISIIEKLIALATIFQTIEFIQIRATFSDQGVWRWATLREEFKIFSRPSQILFNFVFSYKNFLLLLVIRLACGVLLLFDSSLIVLLILLFSTILICLRWRGVFNGGSDYMSVLVLTSLTVVSLDPDSDKIMLGVIWYLSIQLCSSYFIAGIVKLQKANWRNGTALSGFISSTIYRDNLLTQAIAKSSGGSKILAWIIMLFELMSPITLFNQTFCIVYLLFAFAFHLANFYVFGLNRFIFTWISCYPALIYVSGR